MRRRYAGLVVAGAESPRIDMARVDAAAEEQAVRLKASGARLCFISLGAPKQELLADALRRRCPEVGFICVGAALDFISGHMIRASKTLQRMHLEWFWRLASDPARLGGRYVACMAVFAELALRSVIDKSHAGLRGHLDAALDT